MIAKWVKDVSEYIVNKVLKHSKDVIKARKDITSACTACDKQFSIHSPPSQIQIRYRLPLNPTW